MVVEVALGIRLEPSFCHSWAIFCPVATSGWWCLLSASCPGRWWCRWPGGWLCWCSVAGGCCVWCPDAGGCCCWCSVAGGWCCWSSLAGGERCCSCSAGSERWGKTRACLTWWCSLTAHPRPSNGGLLAYELGWGLLATKLALAWLVRCFRYALSSVLLNFVRVLLTTNF